MKKLNIAFLFLVIIIQPVLSQQDPLSSHYMFNTLTYNPGIAGTSGMICATALNRQQWVGFKGAPSTTVFNISAPVSPFKIQSGVGLLVESDNIGFDKDINISGSYSYLAGPWTREIGYRVKSGYVEQNTYTHLGDTFRRFAYSGKRGPSDT